MAGFLLVAALTGSVLAWLEPLDRAFNAAAHRVTARAAASTLDPLVLREHVLRQYPGAQVATVRLDVKPDRGHPFYVEHAGPGDDEVFIDPATGAVLATRQWGDIGQGLKNLMPFIYRLHYALALDTVGRYLLGVAALAWTLDCFVGALLTLPPRQRHAAHRRPWLARWLPAWMVRWRAGGHRLNVDLHRAGGLWPWAMLFVLAWSSVAFNLVEVYQPATRILLGTQFDPRDLPRGIARPDPPQLDFQRARERGRALIAEQAALHGFTVHAEDWMAYDGARRLYRYDVRSSLDVNDHKGATRVHFDADTGALRGAWFPTGHAPGDTFTTWITALHMGALLGWPMKVVVCIMGLAVAMLSVTGVLVWARKRAARGVAGIRSG